MTAEHSYLILRDVRPAANRYRLYEIQIDHIELPNARQLVLTLTWSRIGQRRQSRRYPCPDETKLLRLLQRVLRTRYRHGYQLIERSNYFPALPVLELFPRGEISYGAQLALFLLTVTKKGSSSILVLPIPCRRVDFFGILSEWTLPIYYRNSQGFNSRE